MIKKFELPLRKILSDGGVVVSPTYVPDLLSFEVNGETETVTMHCRYRFARHEPVIPSTAGAIIARLGVNTRRLFSLVMDVGAMQRATQANEDLAELLARSFAELTRQLEMDAAAGPRKHYGLVESQVTSARAQGNSGWE